MNTLIKKIAYGTIALVSLYCIPFNVDAASISVERNGSIHSGDTVLLDVFLSTEGEEVNVIEGDVTIEGNYVINSISTAGSLFTLWPNKPSVSGKTISFAGGSVSGVSSPSLKLFSIALTPNTTGSLSISFSNVYVFKNDGIGTKVSVAGIPKKITVDPKQTLPTNELAGIIANDTTPPEPFSITIGTDGVSFDGKYVATFFTSDTQSGVNRYEVIEDDFPPVRSGSTYVLRDQTLSGTLTVRAIDNAGNVHSESITMKNALSQESSLPTIIFSLLIVLAAIIVGYVWLKKKMHRGLYVLFLGITILGGAHTASAANLYITNSNSNIIPGDTVTATVYVNSGGVNINSAEGAIVVPSDLFDILSVSTAGSVFSLWVEQPTVSGGVVSFSGGVPNPGYFGSAGKVLSMILKAKKAGSASLVFQSSAVRANDGLGTNVSTNQPNQIASSITIGASTPVVPVVDSTLPPAPILASQTTPDQNTWYSTDTTTFTWNLPSSVTTVALLLGTNENSDPTVLYTPPISSRTLEGLSDGTWYFHIKYKNAVGWGPITHRKFKIDNTAPSSLDITPSTSGQEVTFELQSSDALSGIASYSFSIDGDTPIEYKNVRADGSATYTFTSAPAGTHSVSVKAFDKAGNFIEKTVSVTFPTTNAPTITMYPESIRKGERFKIQGKTPYVSLPVLVWVKEEDGEAKSFTVYPESNGIFSFESDYIQKTGLVAVWAETLKKDSTRSNPSDRIFIVVDESIFLKIASRANDVLAVVVPMIGLLVLIVGVLYLGFYRIYMIKRRIRKNLESTEEEMHKVMQVLRADIESHIELLEHTKEKRRLTREEARMLKNFAENIKLTEKYLSMKIHKAEKEL